MRVCLDIAIAYALQKAIYSLNTVKPNLTKTVDFSGTQWLILDGGFANEIYKNRSQWGSGGLFGFTEQDINSHVVSVMKANNLLVRSDRTRRSPPMFHEEYEYKSKDEKIIAMVDFLETISPPPPSPISHQSLCVCFLQFKKLQENTYHECIVCGTGRVPGRVVAKKTVDIYNPWGNITRDVEPCDLGKAGTDKDRVHVAINRIFDSIGTCKRKLRKIRLFSFQWW
jgi:hypothetical protein